MIQIRENRNGNVLEISGDFQRTIVVGDIHGCFMELQHLLRSMNFSENDLLICVGDLVNRGPYPIQTLRFFRETPNAYHVKGNHELRLEALLHKEIEPVWSEELTLSQIPNKERDMWVNYLSALPSVIVTEHAVVVHSRFDPDKSVYAQSNSKLTGLGAKGTERDDNDIPLWFYKWREASKPDRPICIGHEAFNKVELIADELYAIDTKVDRGKKLTGVIFPNKEIVQVNAIRNHRILAKWDYYRDALNIDPSQVPLDVLKYVQRHGIDDDLLDSLCHGESFEQKFERISERAERQFGASGDIDVSVLEEIARVDFKQRIRYHALQHETFEAQEVIRLFPSGMRFSEAATIVSELAG